MIIEEDDLVCECECECVKNNDTFWSPPLNEMFSKVTINLLDLSLNKFRSIHVLGKWRMFFTHLSCIFIKIRFM